MIRAAMELRSDAKEVGCEVEDVACLELELELEDIFQSGL